VSASTTAQRTKPQAAKNDDATAAVAGKARRLGLIITGYLLIFGVWSFFSLYYFTPFILPPPWMVAAEMWHLLIDGTAFVQFGASIGKITAGFALGALLGAPIGLLMGRSAYWRNFFQQPLLALGNVPGLTFAVFALILFGIGAIGPIVAVTFVALPYVALNVAEGVRAVDPHLVQMSTVYGRGKAEIARTVFLPSVVPYLFAALRYGFAMAWKVEALTEVFGGRSGIGFMIRAEYQEFSVTGVLAWTGFFVLFILFVERFVLARLERRIFAWRGGR
jgi:NitT/TauT family transport system permease protein